MNFSGRALYLVAPRQLELGALTLPAPRREQAVLEVLACALCPTDFELYAGSLETGRQPQLILGHQVIGRVLWAWERFGHLVGRPVLVPARVPCGDCAGCRGAGSLDCVAPQRLGYDLPGGFATHLMAPAAALVRLERVPPGFDLRQLAALVDLAAAADRWWRSGSRTAPGDAPGSADPLADRIRELLRSPPPPCEWARGAEPLCRPAAYQSALRLALEGSLPDRSSKARFLSLERLPQALAGRSAPFPLILDPAGGAK